MRETDRHVIVSTIVISRNSKPTMFVSSLLIRAHFQKSSLIFSSSNRSQTNAKFSNHVTIKLNLIKLVTATPNNIF